VESLLREGIIFKNTVVNKSTAANAPQHPPHEARLRGVCVSATVCSNFYT
jgi:hypothetical protein